jgi:cell division protein FtsB
MNAPLSRARVRALHLRELYGQVRRRSLGVRARLRALEEEVQENRQLNRRIAELTDVVTELLLPLADRDESQVRETLTTYQTSIGG